MPTFTILSLNIIGGGPIMNPPTRKNFTANLTEVLFYTLAAGLVVLIFLFDSVTPYEIIGGILYFIPMLLFSYRGNAAVTYAATVTACILLLLDPLLSPRDPDYIEDLDAALR